MMTTTTAAHQASPGWTTRLPVQDLHQRPHLRKHSTIPVHKDLAVIGLIVDA